VGSQANESIGISLGSARSTALGINALDATGGTVASAVVPASATVNGLDAVGVGDDFTIETTDPSGTTQTTSPITYAANSSAAEVAAAINTAASGVGVNATATNSVTLDGLTAAGDIQFTLQVGGTTASPTPITATITDPLDLSNLANAINGQAGTTGVTASFTTEGDKSSLTLTSIDGSNIGIGAFADADGGVTNGINFGGSALAEGGTVAAIKTGTVALSSNSGSITLNNASAELTGVTNSSFDSVATLDVSTEEGAQSAIAVVDAALNSISAQRADLGAVQNRLQSTISNLTNVSENVSAARSGVQDADFATETANLTKNQILQQAGISVLSQANSLPQQVLSLLQ
jgi:flagellin